MPFVLVHKHRKSTILSYVQSIYRWEIGVVIPNFLQHYCSVVKAKAAKAGVYLCEPHKPGGVKVVSSVVVKTFFKNTRDKDQDLG